MPWRRWRPETVFPPAAFARVLRGSPNARGLSWTRGGLAVLQESLEDAMVRFVVMATASACAAGDRFVINATDFRNGSRQLCNSGLGYARLSFLDQTGPPGH